MTALESKTSAHELIERAITIIEAERDVLFDGHQVGGIVKVEDTGDQIAVDAMETMDAWLADARSALFALTASGAGWRDVNAELPPINQVVVVRIPSAYDESDVYAWGSRIEDCEGWLWGVQSSYGGSIKPNEDAGWNNIEADDDYRVTHWFPLPAAPVKGGA